MNWVCYREELRPVGLFVSCMEKADCGWEGGGGTGSNNEIISTISLLLYCLKLSAFRNIHFIVFFTICGHMEGTFRIS